MTATGWRPDSIFPQGLKARLVLLTTGLVVATAALVSAGLFLRLEEELMENRQQQLEVHGTELARVLRTHLREVEHDVAFLAGTPPVEGIARAREGGGVDPLDGSSEQQWRSRLETIFLNLAQAKPQYFQVRFLEVADGGRELVRVDHQSPQHLPRIVSGGELQKKGHRDYFLEAVSATEEGVLISKAELNREKDRISRPIAPVLRVSKPVHRDGRVTALMIINLDLRHLLAEVNGQSSEGWLRFLTNASGDYLSHPDESRGFGFEFGRESNLVSDHQVFRSYFERGDRSNHHFRLPDGELAFVSWIRTQRLERDLALVVKTDTNRVTAVLSHLRQRTVMSLLLMVVLAGGAGAVLANRLAGPIERIASALDSFGGCLEMEELPSDLPGEAGVLVRAFQRMSSQVKEQSLALRRQVTEREKAEDSVKAVVESARDAIIITDGEGHILSFNRQAEQMFGYSSSEVLGRNVKMIMRDEDARAHDGYLCDYRDTGMAGPDRRGRVLKARRKDGNIFDIELTLGEVCRGSERSFIGIIRDISARLARERELREINERLARSNRELEQFSYAASHDLKAPLRSVISFTEILQTNLQDRLTDEDREVLGFINEAGERMRDLIDALLSLSKLQLAEPCAEEFALGQVFEEVVVDLDCLIRETDGRVTHGPLPTVTGSKTQIRQLLQNLVSNGLKYRVPDREPEVRVEACETADGWQLSVSDNGVGIDPGSYDRVFEIFQRLHGREQAEGTGIGLAMCKKIMENHGGRIWIEANSGPGVTFHSFFPAPLS